MDTLLYDLRRAAKGLTRSPGFAVAAVLATGLGIGATTAFFGVVDAVLIRPLPYADADRLVMIESNYLALRMENLGASAPEFLDYRGNARGFDGIAAFQNVDLNLTGAEGPERVASARVTPGLFPLLQATPALGRAFSEQEAEPGNDGVVVLSHGLWQRRFGSDPAAVGKTLTLDGRDRTVIGVMARGFEFPHPSFRFGRRADLWFPLAFTKGEIQDRGRYSFRVIARLAPGVPLENARTEMTAFAKTLDEQNPGAYRGPGGVDSGFRITVVPFKDEVLGDAGRGLLMLMGAVALLLLIACANVANLLLARGVERQQEIAVQMALGATRFRLVRELLAESLLLGLLGGALGLVLALWGADLLAAFGPRVPRLAEVAIDGRVICFALLAALATSILFGLFPALLASRPEVSELLKAGGRGGGAVPAHVRWRQAVVVAEQAVTLVLLVGAGLLVRGYVRLQAVPQGFEPSNVLTMELALPPGKYADEPRRAVVFADILERAHGLPGVQAAGLVTMIPLAGSGFGAPFSVEGRPFDPKGPPPMTNYRSMSPGYLGAMGMRLVKGRDFDGRDAVGELRVVTVNETLASSFFPGQDPLGRRIKLGAPGSPRPWLTIVGVLGDVRDRGLGTAPRPEMYVPYQQEPPLSMTLVVRTAADPLRFSDAVRGAVLAADSDQPVSRIRTMAQVLAESSSAQRFSTTLLALFAGVALALAAIGLYGVTAYNAGRRTHEIGVRVALGASHREILNLVLGQGLRLALIAIPIGLLGALGLGRAISGVFYGVSPGDPVVFAVAMALLLGVAALGSYIPARRAARVEPVEALHCD